MDESARTVASYASGVLGFVSGVGESPDGR